MNLKFKILILTILIFTLFLISSCETLQFQTFDFDNFDHFDHMEETTEIETETIEINEESSIAETADEIENNTTVEMTNIINIIETTDNNDNINTTEKTTEYRVEYEINPKFNAYLEINKNIVGEIKIEGTNIDFPVVFSGENEFYLTHDIYGNETKYGAVFMDMINHGAVLDRNTLIHGHNFEGKDNHIFADLEKYKNKEFFDSHKKIIYNNLYSDMEWEVFAVYVVSSKEYEVLTGFASDQVYFDYVESIKSNALFWSDYKPQPGDYMLTLNTCSYEFKGAHTMVHAKLVKKVDHIKK